MRFVQTIKSWAQEVRMMSYLWHLFLAFCAGAACHYILTNPVAKYPTSTEQDGYIQKQAISPAPAIFKR